MQNNIIFYQTEKHNVTINVTYLNESFWLSQKMIAQLFNVEVPAISKHLSNIYLENELQKEGTISILETVKHSQHNTTHDRLPTPNAATHSKPNAQT